MEVRNQFSKQFVIFFKAWHSKIIISFIIIVDIFGFKNKLFDSEHDYEKLRKT